MSRVPLTDFQAMGDWSANGLLPVLTELQGLKVTVVAGAAAVTDIALAGALTTDSLLSVLRLDRSASAATINLIDVTAEAAITSAGHLQLSTTDTTGDTLIVLWYDKAP